MRILISSASYYPYVSGVSVFSRNIAQHTAAHGDDVFVIAPSKKGKMVWEHKPDKNVTVIRVSSFWNPFHKNFRVPYLTPKNIRKLLAEVKPDVVHVQDPLPFNLMLRNEARKLGIPVVATHHFLMELLLAYFPKFTRPAVNSVVTWYLTKFYNGCSVVTCPTPTTQKTLERDGVKAKLVSLSNGVDVEYFKHPVDFASVQTEFNIPKGVPTVLYLGRVDKDKSVDVVIKAMAKVLKDRKAQLVVVGGGDLLEPMKQKAIELNIQSNVIFTGRVPHDDNRLAAFYQMASIFVTASTIESQGIVILEAMSASKPIVAANAGAIPELVHNEENGFLIKPGDTNAFCKAIEKLLSDTELRKSMGQASVKLVRPHELQICLDKFEEVYAQCVNPIR